MGVTQTKERRLGRGRCRPGPPLLAMVLPVHFLALQGLGRQVSKTEDLGQGPPLWFIQGGPSGGESRAGESRWASASASSLELRSGTEVGARSQAFHPVLAAGCPRGEGAENLQAFPGRRSLSQGRRSLSQATDSHSSWGPVRTPELRLGQDLPLRTAACWEKGLTPEQLSGLLALCAG